MRVSEITEENLTNEIIDCLLFEGMEDTGESVDCIIVLEIPEEGIIKEENSQNTIENILCALLELQRAFYLNGVHKVLLVTTTYHMRRSLHIARYLFPPHIQLIPCPADDTNTRRNNWMDNEEGTKRARMEAMKIVTCVKIGVIPDFEI